MSINLSIKLATKQLIVSQGMGIYIPCEKKKIEICPVVLTYEWVIAFLKTSWCLGNEMKLI